MGTGADEEEVLHILALIMWPEPGGLREDGFEGEAGAAVSIERGLDIERGEAALGDEEGGETG